MSLRQIVDLFLRSAISASRIASWNWFWNSAAISRTLPVHCPTMRSTPGSSFGPMAISATTPMRRNSLHPMSNMKTSAARSAHRRDSPIKICRSAAASASPRARSQRALDLALRLGAPLDVGGGLMIDGLASALGLSAQLRRHRPGMPFLKALMPWATSPIRSEILPRPPNRQQDARRRPTSARCSENP